MTGNKVQTNDLGHYKMRLWATMLLGCTSLSSVAPGTELQLVHIFGSYPGFFLAHNHRCVVFCWILVLYLSFVWWHNNRQRILRRTAVNACSCFSYPSPMSPLSPSHPFPNSINIYWTRARTPALISNSEWDFSGSICS